MSRGWIETACALALFLLLAVVEHGQPGGIGRPILALGLLVAAPAVR